MSELIKDDKPKVLKLGDREFELSPVNLNVLMAIEDEFNCTLGELAKQFEKRQAGTLRSLIWVLLKDKTITKEEIGSLISFGDIERVSNLVMDVIAEVK